MITQSELKKNNISISTEAINLLIEKSNSDRDNLRNEIEKIKSYSLTKKKLELSEIKHLINFSGQHKSDLLINECLAGNISQYKKIVSELYINFVNQILLLRVLSNKVQRLLNIKEQTDKSSNLDTLINSSKPPIFWKEKSMVKEQLSLWNLNELKEVVKEINNTELLCKKNPQASKAIFFNFFLKICIKANSFS
jgi:DNA polymerase-3 subunit delta